MAGRGAPSFLKRQKEQKRAEKAQAKREAKKARRDSRTEAEPSQNAIAEDGVFQDSTGDDPAAGPAGP
jgi:hypothetical protein